LNDLLVRRVMSEAKEELPMGHLEFLVLPSSFVRVTHHEITKRATEGVPYSRWQATCNYALAAALETGRLAAYGYVAMRYL
jgi:hypothetical protein